MKKIILSAILLGSLFSAERIQAQTSFTTLSYSMALGAGNTGDFISKYSFRGFAFDYRSMPTENGGFGLYLGWNTLYEEMPYQTYTYETLSATGYQFRYFNSFPILAMADYYAKPGEPLNPYIGLGAGVQYNVASVDFGIYRFEKDAWPFTLAPEIGAIIELPNGPSLNIGVKYIYGFKTGEMDADSHFLFNVGFNFGN